MEAGSDPPNFGATQNQGDVARAWPRSAGRVCGDGDQHLAERRALFERTYPALLGRGLLDGHGLGPLHAAARALDQQGAGEGLQVWVPFLGTQASSIACARGFQSTSH